MRVLARRALSLCVLTAALFAAGSASAVSSGTITGTVTYTKSAGFPDTGLYRVVLSSIQSPNGGNLQPFVVAETTSSVVPFTYRFQNVPDGTYLVTAYRDVNGSGAIDTAEPYGGFTNSGGGSNPQTSNGGQFVILLTGNASPVVPHDIIMADAGVNHFAVLTGNVTYAGNKAGTLFVQAEIPNANCQGSCDNGTRVGFTSTQWTGGQGTYAYSLLLPAATSYRLKAHLDLDSRGLGDIGEQIPSGSVGSIQNGSLNFGAVVGGSNTPAQDIVVVDPGTTTAPTGHTVSGTLAYGGAAAGSYLISVISAETQSSADVYFSTSQAGAGAFTVNVASPIISPGGCYGIFAGKDADGNGRLDSDTEPATQLEATICGGGTFPFVGLDAPVGTITLTDPTNTGEIRGTIHVTSGTPASGTLVVRAEAQCNDCDGRRGFQAISLVPGTTVYSYAVPLLPSATNYFVKAYVETNGSREFGQHQSTASSQGTNSYPYSVRSPEGSYGTESCQNNVCDLSRPVTVATSAAINSAFGSTCGANHTTLCTGTALVTGVNFEVLLPPSQPPAVVTLSTGFIHHDVIEWKWTDVPGENGFRLVDAGNVNRSGDLDPHVLSHFENPLTPNAPQTRALVAFNHVGMSTTVFKTVYTQPVNPESVDFTPVVTADSMSIKWSSGTVIGTLVYNPLNTLYTVRLSTVTPFSAAVLSTSVAGNVPVVSTAPSGTQPQGDIEWGGTYLPNTVYHAYVNAVNADGLASVDGSSAGYAMVGSGTSPPALPVAAANSFLATSTGALTVAWGANGNAAETNYRVALGSAPFVVGNSSRTLDSTLLGGTTIGMLLANTTYNLFVQTLGVSLNSPYASLGSTATLAVVPAASSTMPVVSASSITVVWSSGVAGAYNPLNSTAYELILSTVSPFSAAVLSTSTLGNQTVLSTTPAGADPAATVLWNVNTQANVPYYAYVRAINHNNIPTAYVSVAVATAPPTAPAVGGTTFLSFSTGTMSVSWLANGNAPGTAYDVLLTTMATSDNDSAGNRLVNSTAPTGAVLQATIGGLEGNTTYYMFMQTQGAGGLTSTVTAFGAAATWASRPALVGFPAAATISGMTVKWSSGTPGSYNPLNTTLYSVILSTVHSSTTTPNSFLGAAGNTVALSTMPQGPEPTATASWDVNTLPNAFYYAYVNAINHAGVPTTFLTVGSSSAPPVVPVAAATTFLATSSGTLTVAWGSNGNASGTTYSVALSSVTPLVVGNSSVTVVSTLNGGAEVGGLLADTTYTLYVQALGGGGLNSAYTAALGSTSTLANAPATAGITPTVTAAEMTVAWSSGTPGGYNPLNTTRYTVTLSTVNSTTLFVGAAANRTTISTAPAGAQPAATVAWGAGYLPNALYYAYVNAVNNNGIPTLFANVGSGAAPPALPVAAATSFVASSTGTLTVAWGANGNVAGTTYSVALSSVTPLVVGNSSVTVISTLVDGAEIGGLLADTTYTLYVQAIGAGGLNSAYTAALASTVTLANAPTTVNFTPAVNATEMTVAWSSGTPAGYNPLDTTRYTVTLSTVNSTTLFVGAAGNRTTISTTPVGAQPAATVAWGAGYLPNALYYAYVNAVNNNGIPTLFANVGSGTAPPALPVAAATTFLATSSGTLTVAWGANGNAGGTSYNVALSSVTPLVVGNSSVTVVSTLNGGTVVSGLLADTTYTLYVQAIGGSGLNSAYTAALGSTATLADVPLTAGVTPSVSATEMSVAWLPAANPLNTTLYTVTLSTVNSTTLFGGAAGNRTTISTTPAGAQPGATVAWGAGYLPNALYYAYVNAVNWNGVPTLFANVGSGTAPPALPVAAATTFLATSSGTLTVAWGANGNAGGTSYNVALSSVTPLVVGNSSVTVVSTLNNGTAIGGLLADTTYTLYVQAIGGSGLNSAYTAALGSTSTLANAPLTVGFTPAVSATEMTVAWSSGAPGGYNPLNTTLYTVTLSTVNSTTLFGGAAGNRTTISTTPAGAQPAATVAWGAGYLPNALYYAYVNAVNKNGVPTLFANVGSGTSPPALPVAAATTFLANSSGTLTVRWDANGNAGGTSYNVALSSVTPLVVGNSSVTVVSTLLGGTTIGGLLADTTYTLYVQAIGGGGLNSAYTAALGSSATLVNAPATAGFTPVVSATEMTVAWSSGTPGAYNPLDTTRYTVTLSTVNSTTLFGSAAGNRTAISTIPAGAQPAATVAWGAGFVPNGLYYAYVNAIGHAGNPTVFANVGSGTAPPALPVAAATTFVTTSSGTLTVAWGANGNAGGTSYNVALSSVTPLVVGNSSVTVVSTLNNGTAIGGLLADTTYTLYVQAIGGGGLNSAYTAALGSTATLANAPLTVGFTPAVSATEMTVAWSSGATGGYNPLDTTLYTVTLSTVNSTTAFAGAAGNRTTISTTPAGAQPAATVLWGAGYLPNTVYYALVNAVNKNGVPTLFANVGSGTSPPALPVAAATTFLTTSSGTLTVAWGANGNAGGTSYNVALSSVTPLVVGNSSVTVVSTLNAGTAIGGLLADTTYTLYVQAIGGGGLNSAYTASLGSTATLANAPTTASIAAVVTAAQMSVAWSSGATGGFNPLNTTLYTVTLSTVNSTTAFGAAGNRTTISTTPAGAQPSATVLWGTGYVPNTLYYAHVNAVNKNGVPTLFATVGSGNSPPSEPAAAAVPFVTVNSTFSMSVAWTANGNPLGTSYNVALSTVSGGFTAASGNDQVIVGTAPAGTNLQATFATGLFANTTYFLYVQTEAGALDSPYVGFGSTSTLAAVPAASAFFTGASLSATQYTLGWASGTVAGGFNPFTSTYTVILSTVNAAGSTVTPIASSAVSAAANSTTLVVAPAGPIPSGAALFTASVLPNTTYFAYVNAVNNNGIPTLFLQVASTSTLANAPAGTASTFTAVNIGSVTVSWAANGNPPLVGTVHQTTYTVVVSTVSSLFFGGVTAGSAVTAVTMSTTGTVMNGLSGNTVYYGYVKATNANGVSTDFTLIGATATLPAAPTALAPTAAFPYVGSSSASVAFASVNPAGSTYTIVMSTVSSLAAGAIAAPGNVSLSTVPAALHATLSGLAPWTTYYAYGNAVNVAGGSSAYGALGSTRTYAASPAAAAASGIGNTSFTANWAINGNPAGIQYYAVVSTNGFATINASTLTTGTSALFTGLLGGVNYQSAVSAVSYDGSRSASTILPTVTTSGGLTPPVAAAFTAVGASGVTANWTDTVNVGVNYRVFLATASDFSTVNIASVTANKSVLFGTGGEGPALAANTLYYVTVQATSTLTASPFVALGSTYTLAAAPTGTAASGATVYSSSATITWNANGNPATTIASIDRSTVSAAFAAGVGSTTVTAVYNPTTYTPVDLLSCTPYFFRVRNVNSAGVATAYDATVNFTTQASTPNAASAFSASPSTMSNQVGMAWYPSPTEGVTRYNLYTDGGTGTLPAIGTTPLGVVYATAPTDGNGQLSFMTPILASSNSYTFRLNAVHRCGVEENTGTLGYSAAVSTAALAAVRASVTSPTSGAQIAGGQNGSNSLTVTAAAVSGTPAKVIFQYAPVGASPVFISIATATVVPYSAAWDATVLNIGTSYLVRAVAYDSNGTADALASAITINVIAPVNLTVTQPAGYTLETVAFNGEVTKQAVLSNGTTGTVNAVAPNGFVVTLQVPPGAFGNVPFAAVTVSPNPPTSTLPPSPAGLSVLSPTWSPATAMGPLASVSPTGLALSITLQNGLVLQQPAVIEMSYPETSGLITGTTLRPSDVKIYTSQGTGDAFVLDPLVTTLEPDTVNRKLRARTTHFTFFAGFGAPALTAVGSNLAGVRVYPVPYKPNGGNPDEGKPFVRGDLTTGIIFDTLPASVSIAIYTMTGRLVEKMDTSASNGTVQWDGRNSDGRGVATGGYFAVIKSGSETIVRKLAVIR